MFQLLFDPVAEIKRAKKQSYSKVLMYLFAAALFETAGLFFFALRLFADKLSQGMIINGILGFLFACIGFHLVVAFFFSAAMHVLDGKGGYYEGLTAVVFSMVAPAVATFFAGALSFIPFALPLAVLLVSFGYVLGAATLFRAAKELFELDYAGVLVGVLITMFPLMWAFMALVRSLVRPW